MLEIGLRKTAVLRVHVALVACIHALNALAVWFRYVVGDFVGRDTFIAFFSVSSEGKLPTWFSAATLLFCGALLGLIAISAYRERDPYRLHWLGLSALFLYMSFDEATEVHEMLGPLATSALGISSAVLSGWVVPAAICLGVLSVLYVSFVAHLAPRSRMLFLGAGQPTFSGPSEWSWQATPIRPRIPATSATVFSPRWKRSSRWVGS